MRRITPNVALGLLAIVISMGLTLVGVLLNTLSVMIVALGFGLVGLLLQVRGRA